MKKLTLVRTHMDKHGTFGILYTKGFSCYTVEKPWDDNKPFISCIPAGEYKCDKYVSSKHGETYLVAGVEGRSYILFHKENTPSDVTGCIALGRDRNRATTLIGDSTDAFREFMQHLRGDDSFDLEVIEE